MVTEQAQRLTADPTGGDLARHIIAFDPRQPQHYLFAAAPTTPQAVRLAAGQLHPDPIPWPTSLTPQAQPFDPATTDTSPLPQADGLVVTYTVAEGDGLADVLTPGMQMNGGSVTQEANAAAAIYEKYGYWTTVGSAITCWALITSLT